MTNLFPLVLQPVITLPLLIHPLSSMPDLCSPPHACLFVLLLGFSQALIKQLSRGRLVAAMLKRVPALHVHTHPSPRSLLPDLTLSSERRSPSNV